MTKKTAEIKELNPTEAQTEQIEKVFNLSAEGKEVILGVLSTKPYVEVYAYTALLNKDEFTEKEANAIINFIGKYPFIEVQAFFAKMNEYFTEK